MADLNARERTGFSLVSLAARRGANPSGLELPNCGHWTDQDGITAICTTPGQWLVMQQGEGLFDRLAPIVGDSATLIELSDSRVAVVVSGVGVRDRLMTFLPIDLHSRAMRPGMAAATIAAHLPVLVRQLDDVPSYEILCARNFAGSFRRALELAGIGGLTD